MPQLSTVNLLTLATPGLALNSLAWVHAWAVTHYGPHGLSWLPPDRLPLGDRVRLALRGKPCPRPQNRRTPADLGLPYATECLPVGSRQWLEIWQIPAEGRAKAVVLLFPAYGESKDTLLNAACQLRELGCATVLVDFRGAGGSSGTSTTLGVREAKDVAIVARWARQRWPHLPLVLFGMSMGAVAVVRAIALHRVRPAAIVLECPFDRLISAVRHRLQVMGAPSRGLAELILFWGCLQHGHNGFAHNPVEFARQVCCPTLLMRGSCDPRVSEAEVRGIFRALAGEKQLLQFAGAGHELLADADAEGWLAGVGEFLVRAIPSSGGVAAAEPFGERGARAA